MPRLELRQYQNHDALHPAAGRRVLAVMCEPNDRARRERMLALTSAQPEAGDAPRGEPLYDRAFDALAKPRVTRGMVAGGLLLTQLQLEPNGYLPSLNRAIHVVTAPLPRWDPETGPYWEKLLGHLPRSRRKMLGAYEEFRPVAHLWAAFVYGAQNVESGAWPGWAGTSRGLPTFLAYADFLLELACRLPSPASDLRFAMDRADAWRFTNSSRSCATRGTLS